MYTNGIILVLLNINNSCMITFFTNPLRFFITILLVAFFLVSPFGTVVQAVENESNTLDDLSSALILIGQQISSSPDLSDGERLTLLTQLIVISSKIIEVRKSLESNQLGSSVVVGSSAADKGLLHVVAKVSDNADSVDVTLFYSATTTATGTVEAYSFTPADNSSGNFDLLVTDLRSQVVDTVFTKTSIDKKELDDLLLLSIRNPLRKNYIRPESAEAYDLVEDVGVYSIVNRIEVLPEYATLVRDDRESSAEYVGAAQIKFFTDQDEVVVMTLKRKVKGLFDPAGTEKYTFTNDVYLSSGIQLYTNYQTSPDSIGDKDDEEHVLVPKATILTDNILEKDIDDFLVGMFSTLPFTSEIPDFSTKLVSFLLQNPAIFNVGEYGVSTDTTNVCYSEFDTTIVTTFVEYILGGMNMQYKDLDEIIYYLAPVVRDERNGSSGVRCSGQIDIF